MFSFMKVFSKAVRRKLGFTHRLGNKFQESASVIPGKSHRYPQNKRLDGPRADPTDVEQR
jgi:hypothetical protein